jgi:DeoR/GlpR family transcriptional regulator of sugar metabolism
MRTELRKSINFLKTFETEQECKQYIQRRAEEKIILIVSDRLGKTLIPQIHNLKQIIVIYHYHQSNEEHIQWTNAYEKVS